jgi:hypothetical protein
VWWDVDEIFSLIRIIVNIVADDLDLDAAKGPIVVSEDVLNFEDQLVAYSISHGSSDSGSFPPPYLLPDQPAMPTFNQTLRPTPYGFFDSDAAFQTEADSTVSFVKRKLGDDVLSVELTHRMIWACLEESCLEYARYVQELKIVSNLVNVLGQPTGSTDLTNKYPQSSLDYLLRLSDAYAYQAGVGGSFNAQLGYINLEVGRQDYDIYTELTSSVDSTKTVIQTLPSGSVGKLRVFEVFHFEPLAAQTFLLNASNITNFLATNFNYESYVNSTVFYVLPVFEDVLRRGMLKEAFRVRRSNYSYQILGTKLRIFPIPTSINTFGSASTRLYLKVGPPQGVLSMPYQDDSIYGVSGPENVPFSILPYGTIAVPGRQWIRQYCLALCKELLGLVRSKFQNIPIPNADLQLNGEQLIQQAREDKEKLATNLKEFLSQLTTEKLMTTQANIAEAMQKQLRYIPIPAGKAIVIG